MSNAPESFGQNALLAAGLAAVFAANPAHADNFTFDVQNDARFNATPRATLNVGNTQNAVSARLSAGASNRGLEIASTHALAPRTAVSLALGKTQQNAGVALGTTDAGNLTGQKVSVRLDRKFATGTTVGGYAGQHSVQNQTLNNGNFQGDRVNEAGIQAHVPVGNRFEITPQAGQRHGQFDQRNTAGVGVNYYGGNSKTSLNFNNTGDARHTQIQYETALDPSVSVYANAGHLAGNNGYRSNTVGVGLRFELDDSNNRTYYQRPDAEQDLDAQRLANQELNAPYNQRNNLSLQGRYAPAPAVVPPAPVVCPPPLVLTPSGSCV